MFVLRYVLYVITFFVTFLWVSKLTTDFSASFLGMNIEEEQRNYDAKIRIILMVIMSLLWALTIML
jgi:hypothetical protein